MQVVIDVTSAAKDERRGIANYGFALLPALRAAAPALDLRIAVRQNRWFRRHHVREMLPGRRPRLLVDGLSRLLLGRIDVLHALGVRLPRSTAFARIATLHDINVLEHPELSSATWQARRRARIEETIARADRLIVLSERGRDVAVELLGVPVERLAVVPHGVDTGHYQPADEADVMRVRSAFGLGTDPYITCVGRLCPRKNQDTLIDAFVRAELDAAWRLVLIGIPPAQLEPFRPVCEAAGVDFARLVGIDWVDDADLPPLLTGAAIHACPSRHEGFGMPVLEAQACGTAVLASDRGGLRETLGGVGEVVEAEDADDIARGLGALANDPARRAALGETGRARVVDAYGWDRVAARTVAVYEAAAAAHRATA